MKNADGNEDITRSSWKSTHRVFTLLKQQQQQQHLSKRSLLEWYDRTDAA